MDKRQGKLIELLYSEWLVNKTIEPWAILVYKWEDRHILLAHYFEEWTEYDVWFTDTNEIKRIKEDQLSYDSIIWQCHLWSILQRFDKYIWIWNISLDWWFYWWYYDIKLNYTKPLMERSEKQNKELVLFMEKVKWQ